MHRGYVKLWRRLKDSEFWLSEPFTRPQAFVDLVILANHKDTYFRVRGNRIDVKRGQLAHSELTLSERWKWSRGKVRRFLEELESDDEQKIVQQKNNITSLITIVNYDQYQGDGTTNGTTDSTTDSTTDGTHLKNVKECKRRKDRESVALPDWIDPKTWSDFREFRIRKKAPLTDRASKGIIRELEKLKQQGHDPDKVIEQSIIRGWAGVFPLKDSCDHIPSFSDPEWQK